MRMIFEFDGNEEGLDRFINLFKRIKKESGLYTTKSKEKSGKLKGNPNWSKGAKSTGGKKKDMEKEIEEEEEEEIEDPIDESSLDLEDDEEEEDMDDSGESEDKDFQDEEFDLNIKG